MSPAGVISFFHIGTICFSSSMHHLHALNASSLCSAAAIIKTMFSPTCISPTRWIMLTSITSNFSSAVLLSSSSFFSAISA